MSQTHQGDWYPELERARAVAALEIVDHVIILDNRGLEGIVKQIRPKTLVLGREFEDTRSNEVSDAVLQVLEYGGEVYFEAGEPQYASTDFLFGRQDDLERDRWMRFQTVLKDNGIICITDGICNFNSSFSWQTMHKKGILTSSRN